MRTTAPADLNLPQGYDLMGEDDDIQPVAERVVILFHHSEHRIRVGAGRNLEVYDGLGGLGEMRPAERDHRRLGKMAEASKPALSAIHWHAQEQAIRLPFEAQHAAFLASIEQKYLPETDSVPFASRTGSVDALARRAEISLEGLVGRKPAAAGRINA
jgi:hypothetical protein